tara:strand:- start:74 stop:334 length:261 start_codon:yes stop_codon:yes gene_type:complete
MKYLITTMIFIFSCSAFSAAKWDEAGCGRIEAGVGQLIGVSESMRGLSEAAGRDGDYEGEEELRNRQMDYLEQAENWSSIYSAFCK